MLLFLFQKFSCLFMHHSLDQFQPLFGQVVQPVAFEAEVQQLAEIVPVLMGEHSLCFFNEIVIHAGHLRGSVFLDCFLTCQGFAGSEIQERIAVVEQRGRCNDLIRFAVNKETKVAVMTICIQNHSVKNDHIVQRFYEFVSKLLIVFVHGFQPAAADNSSNGNIRQVFACEQRTGRAKRVLPFGKAVWNRIDSKKLRYLRGIVLRIRFIARIGRTLGAALKEISRLQHFRSMPFVVSSGLEVNLEGLLP